VGPSGVKGGGLVECGGDGGWGGRGSGRSRECVGLRVRQGGGGHECGIETVVVMKEKKIKKSPPSVIRGYRKYWARLIAGARECLFHRERERWASTLSDLESGPP